MKKIIAILPLILGTLIILNSFTIPPPEDEIIGAWVLESDNLSKMTCDEYGVMKNYYDDELINTLQYLIAPTCREYTSGGEEVFIKTIDTDGNISCDLLNGFHEDTSGVITLSITSESGKLFLFTKE